MAAPLIGLGLRALFGLASRPFMATGAAVVADQTMNDGRGTAAATDWGMGKLRDTFMPESAGDWMQLGAFGFAALNMMQGNMMNAAALGAVGYYMNDILSSELFQNVMGAADQFLNENFNIDIPDNWYRNLAAEQDTPQEAPTPSAPSMG